MVLEDHMVGAVSEAGVGHDKSRGIEDHYLVDHDLGLVILADAAGGHSGADFAAETVVEAAHEYLKREIPRYEKSGSIINLITCSYLFKQAVEHAHNALLEKAEEIGADPRTTLEIAYLLRLEDETQIVWGTVGDSKQYLVDENGITDVDLTKNRNHQTDNWIGGSYSAFVFMNTIEEGQRWIICSDGIVQKGIEDIMTDLTQNPQAHAQSIADEAKRLRSQDDRTVIVIDPYQLEVESFGDDTDAEEEINRILGIGSAEEIHLSDKPDPRLYKKKGEEAQPGASEFYAIESDGPNKLDTTERQFDLGRAIEDSLDTPTEPPSLVEVEIQNEELSGLPEEKEPSVIVDLDAKRTDETRPEIPSGKRTAQEQAEQQGGKFPVVPAIFFGVTVALAAAAGWVFYSKHDTKTVDTNVSGIEQPEYPLPAGLEHPKPIPVPIESKPDPIGPDPEPTDLEKITEETPVAPVVEPEPVNSLYQPGERTLKQSYLEGKRLYGLADSGKVKGSDNKIKHFEAASMYLNESVPNGRFSCSTGTSLRCNALYFLARSHYQLAKIAEEGSEEREDNKSIALGLYRRYLSSNSRGVNAEKHSQYAVLLKWGENALKDVRKTKALK